MRYPVEDTPQNMNGLLRRPCPAQLRSLGRVVGLSETDQPRGVRLCGLDAFRKWSEQRKTIPQGLKPDLACL